MATAAVIPAIAPRESASQTARKNFQIVASILGLDPDIRTVLTTPLREMSVEVPVKIEDGRVQIFSGARVQHNGVRGPAMGGVRFHPTLDLELMRALAEIATWKCAAVAIPFGGASGGVMCDPATLSVTELERLTRQFTSRIHVMLGPYRDVSTPDLNTDAQIMKWIFDEYCSIHGFTAGSVTGKPSEIGGNAGREAACGRGLALMLKEAARELGLELQGLKIAVQGFGKVGFNAAQAMQALGCRIVAASDIYGGVYSRKGICPRDLRKHVRKHGQVSGFSKAEIISNAQLLECDCDVLVLAAAESVVNAGNAARIQAKLVLEGADLAVTPAADQILENRGIVVVPDVLAGSGEVTASYFEWAQNLQQIFWKEDHLNKQLEIFLVRAYQNVNFRAKKQNLSLRLAAYSIAVERVARCEKLRRAA